MKRHFFSFALLFCAFLSQCQAQVFKMDESQETSSPLPRLAFVDKAHYVSAAMQLDDYLPLIDGKRVGVVGNQTSIIGETHLVDTLLSLGVNIMKIYTPEHGFRGTADALPTRVPKSTAAKMKRPAFLSSHYTARTRSPQQKCCKVSTSSSLICRMSACVSTLISPP